MFIVAGDLDEAQRGRLTSSLSLRNMNITDCTLDAVQTVFVELLCTDTAAVQTEPSSSKTILKMSLDNGLVS